MPNSSRRALLKALAVAPVTVPLALRVQADAAGLLSTDVCLVQPELAEGPFYTDPDLVRRDVTEGREGAPLELALQVVDADCRPIEGARVDVWHCDAQGNYSGFAQQGSDRTNDTSDATFLRGTQVSDGEGIVSFRTIFPGWYRGRATHIHYKIFLDDRTALTSQLFFPEEVNQEIYGLGGAYARNAEQEVTNERDGIARRAGNAAHCTVRQGGDGYEAALVVGVAGA